MRHWARKRKGLEEELEEEKGNEMEEKHEEEKVANERSKVSIKTVGDER